jgi:hypothetical protein
MAATAVGYYKIERERRLENAMGKIVRGYNTFATTCYKKNTAFRIITAH